MTTVHARPFLKWAGGKGRLLSQYAPYLPQQFATYYEPFCGGGAVFFHLAPHRAVLSDINPEIINVYICVRDAVEAVIALLQEHAAAHTREYYYTVRDYDVAELSPVARAARLIYLNRTCYNGLYRENAKGIFNVPMGAYTHPNICQKETLRSASDALQSTQITHASFDHVLNSATSDDLVYFDPPYHPRNQTSNFTQYSRFAFQEAEQRHLQDVFGMLAKRGIRAMVSNSDTELIHEIYQGYRIITVEARRAINVQREGRGKINEVLVFNWH